MDAGTSDSIFYVRELLARFGARIYLGKRQWELEWMEEELDELFESGLILREEYLKAKRILSRELRELAHTSDVSESPAEGE
ncbi:MAG: hypothetical protein BLITH_0900 [Brockia lithotrophica]|uniref:Gas vesicle protein GvpG n=1 Tax=Brockia lithotrophica TaxID=933949 RepID=A0A2T5G957_9BACL|nr:MAG: hypothetical protein BLITH_0900 [Brockia lithotrophica]